MHSEKITIQQQLWLKWVKAWLMDLKGQSLGSMFSWHVCCFWYRWSLLNSKEIRVIWVWSIKLRLVSKLPNWSFTMCLSVSPLLSVLSGVPRGSILGPFLYTLIMNERREVIHNDTSWPPFTLNCDSCGNICCFVDVTKYSSSGSNQENLSNQI